MRTPVLCTAALLAGLAAPRALAQPQALATDQLDASMIANNDPNRPMALVEERLRVAIDGQHASSTLTQVFQNNTGIQVEGRYRLQPGSGSQVEGFAYWNGEQKIVGEVFERQMANEVYNNVTQRRRDPGLLEADGEGAFAFKVFPINAGEKKRIELVWSKWLERRAHTVRYRAPVHLGGAEIVIALDGATKNIRSPSHKLRVEKTATGVRLRSDGALRKGGELVLEWDVDDADWTPAAAVQPGGKDDAEGWFAVALAAPDLPASAVAAKDVTIVVDRSGSMTGEPIAHARAAAADMIRRLHDGDRVNVISFSDEVDPLFAAPQPVNDDTRQRAIAYVQRLHEGGGTDIALALATAIKTQAGAGAGPGRPRVIVFVTDGQSDPERALAAAKSDTGDVRLFTLGLGKDVNRPLLQRLAAQKRGQFSYIADAGSIETEVARLANRTASPLLVDITVDVEGAQALRMYPRSLPDLFANDELVVTGRLRGTGAAKFVVRGKLANGKQVAFSRSVDIAKAGNRPWVGRMWAQSRVEHLLEEIALGAAQPELKNEVIDLALLYNFVTPFTAFLAIPESELGQMAGTVAAARERKRKLQAANPDTAQIDGRALTIDPTSTSQSITIDGSYTRNVAMPSRSFDEASDAAPRAEVIGTHDKRHGCAGCATGTPDGALLVGALVLLVLRRRSR